MTQFMFSSGRSQEMEGGSSPDHGQQHLQEGAQRGVWALRGDLEDWDMGMHAAALWQGLQLDRKVALVLADELEEQVLGEGKWLVPRGKMAPAAVPGSLAQERRLSCTLTSWLPSWHSGTAECDLPEELVGPVDILKGPLP